MQVRTRIATTITLLALASMTAAIAAGGASASSDVVGHLRGRQHRGNEHDRSVRPARRRLTDADARLAVCGRRCRHRKRYRLAGSTSDHE